eukprot:195514-Chlamydomonas_euryale.AAC.5
MDRLLNSVVSGGRRRGPVWMLSGDAAVAADSLGRRPTGRVAAAASAAIRDLDAFEDGRHVCIS